MAKKNSKNTTSKRHTAIPAKADQTAPPKKAAEAVTPATVISAAAPKISKPIDRAAVAAKIAALRGNDADVARDAAAALGGLGDASAVEPLIEVLGNADDYFHSVVRAAAASSLAQLNDPRAFEPLVHAVRDNMAEASAEAVRALAKMGDPRAVGVLIDIVRNPSGYFLSTVRLAAVAGLKQLGGERATAELARVAADGYEDPVIREAATNSR